MVFNNLEKKNDDVDFSATRLTEFCVMMEENGI